MMLRSCFLVFVVILWGCSPKLLPEISFAESPVPPPPDYSQLSNWAAHPDKEDPADRTPEGVTPEAQATAAVDVFFIHPTTFNSGQQWNADVRDAALNAATDNRAILHQPSVFNASCRVFVPRYRQMSLSGFRGQSAERQQYKQQALELAYSDVQAAFAYYLEHENHGRPFILAGHSQGALHGIHLLKEKVDGTELQDRLVAAYLPGWAFKPDAFAHIPPCESPGQTGCVMGWNTYLENTYPDAYETYYKGSLSTNPLNWRIDEQPAPKSLHRGMLMRNYKIIRPQKIRAQNHDGLLWINRPHPLWWSRRYHIGDINLFWVNIRENVALRVAAYLDQHKLEGE